MKKTEIMKNVSRSFHKGCFKIQKHSPEILIIVGVVGAVTSAVVACKATLKAKEVIDVVKHDVDLIHDCMANETLAESGEYTKEDGKKDLSTVYVQAGVKLVKLYAPAVALGVLSLASILTSNNILRKRNVALAAAYAAIDQGFKEYRTRVVERFGKDIDHELKYNIKKKEFEETVTDEKGKEKTIKKTVEVADPNTYSDYARFFDNGCTGWEKDPEYNLMFLRAQQQYANDLLVSRGHIFLNEVYDMLGIPRTKAGQVVGWIYNDKNPVGDNYVDFGIYDTNREAVRNFVNGYERTILLDFNVDGNVLEMM